ncbi:hypothetical protein E2562_030050 [Oryza meyeriana var. granulata]|uniref:Uncharacterized protein n=1 Tax=Oryza meyeriana var. granulata TaxID=110450 RepID=A0A6G1CJC5_9ORYZ|nr:hypothetical protein E2562_030050 [Oryza meyeriana var. granulata]
MPGYTFMPSWRDARLVLAWSAQGQHEAVAGEVRSGAADATGRKRDRRGRSQCGLAARSTRHGVARLGPRSGDRAGTGTARVGSYASAVSGQRGVPRRWFGRHSASMVAEATVAASAVTARRGAAR